MNFENAYQLVVDKLMVWAKELIRLLPNIALAALIIVVGSYLVKALRNILLKIIAVLYQIIVQYEQ